MATSSTFAGFTQTLRVHASANADLAKQQIARAVEVERARVQAEAAARSPEKPGQRTYVDGRENAPIMSVRPDGMVVLEWRYLREIAAFAMETLLAETPRISGKYQSSIRIFIGETETEGSIESITPETMEILIGPTVPYARRLEVAKGKDGLPFSVSAEWHMIQRSAALVAARYGSLASVREEWFQLSSGGYVVKGYVAPKLRRFRNPARAALRDARLSKRAEMRYPGLRIRLSR